MSVYLKNKVLRRKSGLPQSTTRLTKAIKIPQISRSNQQIRMYLSITIVVYMSVYPTNNLSSVYMGNTYL